MRELSRPLALAALAAFVLEPAAAQPPGPCSAVPFFDFDGTAENLLGISPGFVGEYCQHLDLTPLVTGAGGALCTNDGSYFVIGTHHGITRNGGSPQAVFGDVRIRRALAIANDLDAVVSGVTGFPLGVPPGFPSYFESEILPYDPDAANALLEEAGWVMNDDGIRVCRGWAGDDSTQALPADVGAGPVHDIYATFDAGEIWELVQSFPGFEQFRSVDMGVTIAPIGGTLTGSQVVPPNASTARGAAGVWRESPDSFRVWVQHDVPNPITARLYYTPFGENGPQIASLGAASNPINVIHIPPDPDQFANDLDDGLIALVIENALGESIRTNLARAERRIEPEPETYSIRTGLSHPLTPNCYDLHYVGGGDATLQFDFVEESPVTFANGTVPRFDEIETPRGGPHFNFKFGIFVDSGPAELFPPGFFEQGTGIPLTDGCLEIPAGDPIEFDRHFFARRATLETFDGLVAELPPLDVTESIRAYREGGTWRTSFRLDVPGAAGLGIDAVLLRIDAVDGIFGDPFKYPNTDAWDVTVNPP